MKKNRQYYLRGEVSTLLLLGTLAVLGVVSLLSTSAVNQNRQVTSTQAACSDPAGCGGACDQSVNNGCGFGGCRWWERCQNGSCLDTTAHGTSQAAPDACHDRATAANQPSQPTATPTLGGVIPRETATPAPANTTIPDPGKPDLPTSAPTNDPSNDGPGGHCSPGMSGADSRGCGGADGCREWEQCDFGPGRPYVCKWQNIPSDQQCGAQPTVVPTQPPASTAAPTLVSVLPRQTATPIPSHPNCGGLNEGCCIDKAGAINICNDPQLTCSASRVCVPKFVSQKSPTPRPTKSTACGISGNECCVSNECYDGSDCVSNMCVGPTQAPTQNPLTPIPTNTPRPVITNYTGVDGWEPTATPILLGPTATPTIVPIHISAGLHIKSTKTVTLSEGVAMPLCDESYQFSTCYKPKSL